MILLVFLAFRGDAQDLYIPRDFQRAIDKGTRNREGTPGKNYWQNFTDYALRIKFHPKNRKVEGSAEITYYNNSPDTLKKLVFRLYPNYYKKGVMRDRPVEVEDESTGMIIDRLICDSRSLDVSGSSGQVFYDQTLMIIRGVHIRPGQVFTIQIAWHFTLNKGSHNRMGQVNEGAYFLAYCYPRIAVYDDVNGWDQSQYAGRNEPYFEFGNVTAAVTVPKNYVVWATGELQNAAEVFRPSIAEKWEKALTRDEITLIIDSLEADKKQVTAAKKWNTFRFKASNVPDFAIAVSNHYTWQACGLTVDTITPRRVLVNTVFGKNQRDFYEVNDFTRKTMEVMSFDFPGWPYPYPHMTIFEGADQMEFPMMVNDNPLPDRAETIELTDHEVFHTFFPFFMGTNQTRYAWMDEGWATIGEWYISPIIDSTLTDEYGIERTRYALGREEDIPLIFPSYEMEDSYFVNAYAKPAFIYLYLKDMLGDSLFRKALHHYMKEWNGKHPQPWDFFYAINRGSGINLDWYWKAWFYDIGTLDLEIVSVNKSVLGHDIQIRSLGSKPAPLYITVFYKDGTREQIHKTAFVWSGGNREVTISVPSGKEVMKVSLLNIYVPDVNEKNNTWPAGE